MSNAAAPQSSTFTSARSRRSTSTWRTSALLLGCVALCCSLLVGCGEGEEEGDDASSTATGGAPWSAVGGSATGGAPSTGGQLGSGGTFTSSGGVASGGAVGSGGQTAGVGGADASGGTSSFEPCPATGPCKILPLGDSITFGLGVDGGGGYRIELFAMAREGGKNLTFVGSQVNGPDMVGGEPFPKNHDGYSGFTIAQIDEMIPDKLAPQPNIVLLHLGTNDMYKGPDGAPERLGSLIDQITEALPSSLLVVSTIIPFPLAKAATDSYNAALPAIIQSRTSAGAHIVLVDQNSDFPTDELADGVHPNAAGYARMAGVWYTAIAPHLH